MSGLTGIEKITEKEVSAIFDKIDLIETNPAKRSLAYDIAGKAVFYGKANMENYLDPSLAETKYNIHSEYQKFSSIQTFFHLLKDETMDRKKFISTINKAIKNIEAFVNDERAPLVNMDGPDREFVANAMNSAKTIIRSFAKLVCSKVKGLEDDFNIAGVQLGRIR